MQSHEGLVLDVPPSMAAASPDLCSNGASAAYGLACTPHLLDDKSMRSLCGNAGATIHCEMREDGQEQVFIWVADLRRSIQ
jgi:hypothetical protein